MSTKFGQLLSSVRRSPTARQVIALSLVLACLTDRRNA